ncbi:C4-dicarboxylate ABC transporter permease [Gallibacterium genomosp. 1]|uniref:TRAP transporter small permease protein n=1 Tax=Gallibacterium genomosp. 1 TaxID=155515 RepID=A0A0A2YIY0_9PAST|nr:TRAP transporter small permease [Gallibacterium genomosp. 1]KGQ37304.1 C4-dicarboxylate ABC transporter permease [Gallibacterium genomosp. 1]OBX02567.1 C4-dicarboxylate ABC transporter permease [Gallibacterium genomosp. 1]
MKLSKILDKTLKYLSILALVTMISLVFFNAVLRYFFDSGIAWSEEFARICFVYMIFLGIILVAKEKKHLTVDIIISYLPPRYKILFNIISDILILISTSFLALGAYQLMILTYSQKMPATGISSSFLYVIALLSAIIYFILITIDLLKSVSKNRSL